MNNIINAQTKVEMQPKINLLGLSKKELSLSLNRLGVEKKELPMRVQQLFSWIHVHGKKSFDVFSHQKGVVTRGNWLDIPTRYAPYKGKLKQLKTLMKFA